jgi:hypothetical protein
MSVTLTECDIQLDPPSQHITLFGIFDNQYQLIDTINFVLDTLDQRTERIRDIIDKSVRDPVGCDGNIIFELLDTPSDVLRVWCASEVELDRQTWVMECKENSYG